MNTRHCPTCYSNQFVEKPDGLHCAFCDNRYIEPKQRSDRQEMMLEIAYTDLRNMNFIEAESAFEEIIALYPDLHEAYWGCLSSRCGLKYEEDYSGKKIPTCCLPHMQSILEVSYYQKATALADPEIAAQYRDTAEYLERVRQTWVAHASKLPPYDIFISYKESDAERGLSRTEDSINAQELYVHLTRQGYRVFYSHDSLRDVVGEKYEPYIFHALETAKAMIVYGTKPEYINSTWLKNEWMRYMKKMEQGEKQKGSLIVVYEGFSPYELPGALRFQGIDGTSRSCYADIDDRMRRLIPQVTAKQEEARRAEEARKAEEVRKAEEIRKAEKAQKALSTAEAHTAELARLREMTAQAEKANQDAEARRQEEARKAAAERLKKARVAEEAKKAEEVQKLAAAQKKLWETLSQGTSMGLELHQRQDGKFTVTGMGRCNHAHVCIPSVTDKGEEIVEIADEAFSNSSILESVTIPSSVTAIGARAFFHCQNLTSVTLPNSIITIGESAFSDCKNLTNMTIPDSVTTVGKNAFCRCVRLNITIPNSVTTIGDYAFSFCQALENITIPTSVTTIGKGVFILCQNLKSVTLPDSIRTIEEATFGGCEKLVSIEIPSSVTTIDFRAFNNCTSMASITIPDSVTIIGNEAFDGCRNLAKLYIGKGVKKIGRKLFSPHYLYKDNSPKTIFYAGAEEQWRKIKKFGWKRGAPTITMVYNASPNA